MNKVVKLDPTLTPDAKNDAAPKDRPVKMARPQVGDIDFAAMRREIIAKFPKTLAKLAE